MNLATTVTQARKRPWLAAVLSLLHPGIGHLYLREWLRAVLWFTLIVTASVALLPAAATPATLSVEAVLAASRAVPTYVAVTMLSLTVFSMLDAYVMATRHNQLADRPTAGSGQAAATTPRCPSCGHDLDDPEIGFCPWCAAEFESAATSESRTAW